MNKKYLMPILNLILCLTLVFTFAGGTWADDGGETYTIMHPDKETLQEWINAYNNAPLAHIETEREGFQIPSPRGSLSLLDHLQYTPSQRNQGICGNCWAWAGTGCLGIALDVEKAIKDRLSVQYVNSCKSGGYACCGGWLSDVADFYTSNPQAIPWSNTNAHWQDGSKRCSDGSSSVACGSISTTPDYPITSIQEEVVPTQGVGQATAIANIKNVLNQNKAVWFGFYLPDSSAWSDFYSFWGDDNESVVYDIDQFCGTTYNYYQGGGHAVLCVGYNDDNPANKYWIMLNSWGTTTGRPNGLFLINMDMNYSCTNPGLGNGDYSFYWQTLDVSFPPAVSIDAPAEVDAGSSFTAFVDVDYVEDLTTYQFRVTYDPTVIEVTGVTDGLIDSTPIPTLWAFVPPSTQGTIQVTGNAPGVNGVTGSGYLAEIHFHVVGSACNSSDLTFSDGKLFDEFGAQMPGVTWLGDSVHVKSTVGMVIDPTPKTVQESETFTVDIKVTITGGTDVDSAGAHLDFDTTYLEVLNITPGATLTNVVESDFDNVAGTIDYTATAAPGDPTTEAPPANPATSDFVLATVQFQAKNVIGTTPLTFVFAPPPRETSAYSEGTNVLDPEAVVDGSVVITAAEPTVAFSPSSLSFAAIQGGADPADKTLDIWNAGGGTLNWTATDDVLWLDETPKSGSSTGVGDKTAMTVSVNISGMVSGTYSANITISAPGATNTPQTVPVSLRIGDIIVSVDAPDEVGEGSNFTAKVDVTELTNFDSYQFKVSYDTSVLEVLGGEGSAQGATNGLIDSTTIPVDMWMFSPPGEEGTMFLLGNVAGVTGVTGSGYILEVHFHVIGEPCNTSPLSLSEGKLFDKYGTQITPVAWLGDSVHVAEALSVTDCSADANPTKVGHETTFSATVTSGVPPYTYDWDFGDGNSSAESSPIHQYSAAATYNVTLTVTDNVLDTDTCYFDLVVNPPLSVSACQADPNPVRLGQNTTFSTNVAGGVGPYTYDWDFGDGTPHSDFPSPTYAYNTSGNHSASITVTDSLENIEGCSFGIFVCLLGDANLDGIVNMADVTKVERIILELDPPTACADANEDGIINMADVTKIERIILGID